MLDPGLSCLDLGPPSRRRDANSVHHQLASGRLGRNGSPQERSQGKLHRRGSGLLGEEPYPQRLHLASNHLAAGRDAHPSAENQANTYGAHHLWAFGDGSGRDLNNVVEIDFGPDHGKIEIGSLACWEHTQPLLKYHTISQGEQVHVAMWPPLAPSTGVDDPGLWSMSVEGCQSLSQTYAIESAAFVLHTTGVCNQGSIEKMKTQDGIVCREPGGGHSCVIGPDGRRLTTPIGDGTGTEEGIVYADLDMGRMVATRGFLDVVGHYSRPDLLWLGVDKRQKEVVVPVGQGLTKYSKMRRKGSLLVQSWLEKDRFHIVR